jgi:hypothetical protein
MANPAAVRRRHITLRVVLMGVWLHRCVRSSPGVYCTVQIDRPVTVTTLTVVTNTRWIIMKRTSYLQCLLIAVVMMPEGLLGMIQFECHLASRNLPWLY